MNSFCSIHNDRMECLHGSISTYFFLSVVFSVWLNFRGSKMCHHFMLNAIDDWSLSTTIPWKIACSPGVRPFCQLPVAICLWSSECRPENHKTRQTSPELFYYFTKYLHSILHHTEFHRFLFFFFLINSSGCEWSMYVSFISPRASGLAHACVFMFFG